MKKQPKQFLLLLVALVLLVGGYFGLRAYNKVSAEKEEQALEETVVTMIDAAVEDVVEFSYDYNGETYTYEKEDGIWYYAPDHSLNLQQGMVSGMLMIVRRLAVTSSPITPSPRVAPRTSLPFS